MVIVLLVVVFETVFLVTVDQYFEGGAVAELQRRATVKAAVVNQYMKDQNLAEKSRYILETSERGEPVKVEILNLEGRVLLDSYGLVESNWVQTEDVAAARSGQVGVWTGQNEATGEEIAAVSLPLMRGERMSGVLRYTSSLEGVKSTVHEITIAALLVGAMAVAVALSTSLWLAKRIAGPVVEVTAAARKMAEGDFSARAKKRDDDEVGQLAETLNAMAEEVVKGQNLKNEFISSISHEIRTPLTSIKGWSETLVSGGLEDREETEMGLQVIVKETNRLIVLVEDLLDVSKIQAGRLRMEMCRVEVQPLMEEIWKQFRQRAESRGVQLELSLTQEPLLVLGDTNRLKQVLVNLLDNAFKFTPEGGLVELRAERSGREAVLAVADSGEGIAPEELPLITEKFHKGSGKQGGSGLGLSISKEIAELHGGRLEVRSEQGQGATVLVYVPLV